MTHARRIMERKIDIAICIPSFNESSNINNVTIQIDNGLCLYYPEYSCAIVNADNCSPDKTNVIFNNTRTKSRKYSLLTTKTGKGENLLNFFSFCKDYDINYAATFDADLVSITPLWIKQILDPIIYDNYDYVTPIYFRGKCEGNITNHFVRPSLLTIFNNNIEQPIAGDFAFSKHFINKLIENRQVPQCILQYGIDLFITYCACFYKFRHKQVLLTEKKHKSNYSMLESMFIDVKNTMDYALNTIGVPTINYVSCTYNDLHISNEISNLPKLETKPCSSDDWAKCLGSYIANMCKKKFDKLPIFMQNMFMDRVVTYWNEVKNDKDTSNANKILQEQYDLTRKYFKHEYNIKD